MEEALVGRPANRPIPDAVRCPAQAWTDSTSLAGDGALPAVAAGAAGLLSSRTPIHCTRWHGGLWLDCAGAGKELGGWRTLRSSKGTATPSGVRSCNS